MGSPVAFQAADLEQLQTEMRGELLRPDSAGYDSARRVWNGLIDKKPALIARCTGVADIMRALAFARAHQLLVAVRGGGHSAAGFAVCDGGMVIDLSPMKGIRVDPAARTVRAQPGVTWGEFDRETQAFGLATTGGGVSTTGIAGLTLGGGLGFLMRSCGLACDNLLSVDLVTSDGRFMTASSTENADLFWGVRGGGGNLGIVTSFEYRLRSVGPVLGGMLVHPLDRCREALRFYREFTRNAPDELTVFAGLMTSPDGMPVVAFVLCYSGAPEEGEAIIRPLRAFGPPIADQVHLMPYVELQSLLDSAFPSGLQVYWRADFLTGLEDATIDTLITQSRAVTSALSLLLIEHLGGAVSRVGREETAFDHRRADYSLAIISRWSSPADAEPNIAWARETWQAMRPFASGVYVNYLGDEGEDRIRAAYGSSKYNRLSELKRKYDPANFFRLNQNINPVAADSASP